MLIQGFASLITQCLRCPPTHLGPTPSPLEAQVRLGAASEFQRYQPICPSLRAVVPNHNCLAVIDRTDWGRGMPLQPTPSSDGSPGTRLFCLAGSLDVSLFVVCCPQNPLVPTPHPRSCDSQEKSIVVTTSIPI